MNSSWIEEAHAYNMELDADEEIFNQFDVILTRAPAQNINEINVVGVMFVFRRQDSFFIEWRPNCNVEIAGNVEIAEDAIDEWSIINQITFTPAGDTLGFLAPKLKNLRIPLLEIKKLKVQGSELLLYDRDENHTVTCNFKRSSAASLLRMLQNHRLLKQSSHDRNVYMIKDPEFEKLQKSFAELNIEEIKTAKAPKRPLLVHGYEFLSQIGKSVLGTDTERNRDSRPGAYRFEIGTEEITDESSPELDSRTEIDSLKAAREENLPPRQLVKRDKPLALKQWQEFITEDGKVSDPERIKEIIFRGGIEPSLRAEVWKFLLNYDLWEHSTVERLERRKSLEEEYYRMKAQWSTLSNSQEKNHSGYRDRKCQIEKDVKRTDRNLEFYNGDDNPNIERLQAILLTYVMYNFDIGYVQGMSDLLSPILYMIDDEAASFWCFVGFMEKVFRNFDEDQAGMKNQLSKLRTLMEFANPRLFKYLKSHDSDNMYFCFRWLLVWFKREFTHDDILELWEVLWTSMPCANFHLIVGIAILDNEMSTIIENEYGFTEILKHVNDMSEKMDLKHILEVSESIYQQIVSSSKLTDRVRAVIGMEAVKEYGDDPYNSEDEEEIQIAKEREKRLQDEIDHTKAIDMSCDNGLDHNFF